MDVIALPLTGRLYFFIPVPRATASPLPWADMLRPFRPSKMYKLQSRDKACLVSTCRGAINRAPFYLLHDRRGRRRSHVF